MGCDHQSSVAFVVLLIYVYIGTGVESIHDINETFAASQHQAILLGIDNDNEK